MKKYTYKFEVTIINDKKLNNKEIEDLKQEIWDSIDTPEKSYNEEVEIKVKKIK